MVLDMLVLAMPDLDMLDTDMAILATDTPPLDTMARGLLMLSPRLRLMLDSTMVDMDMRVLVIPDLDMLVLDIPDLDMLDTDMAILPMDTPPLDTMARGLLMPSLRLRLMLDSTMEDMDMVSAILVLAMLDTDLTIVVSTISKTISRISISVSSIAKTRIAETISISSIVESSISLSLRLGISRPLAIVSKGGVSIGRIAISVSSISKSGISKTSISKTISISTIVESSISLSLRLSISRPLAIVSKGGVSVGRIAISVSSISKS